MRRRGKDARGVIGSTRRVRASTGSSRRGKVVRELEDLAAEKALDVAQHVGLARRDDVDDHAVLVLARRAGDADA